MIQLSDFQVIAFDADDTLWDCQSHFERVENALYDMIRPYCDDPAAELFATESANMADLGYGSKAFTISIIETALRVAGDNIAAHQLQSLLASCRTLLRMPATPLPGVEETLQRLCETGRWQLALFTKGELQDQENKLRRSGLSPYFSHIKITSNKDEAAFLQLCQELNIQPARLLMVGNSLRSDIAPALAIGASAIYIPFHVTWQLEKTEPFAHERMMEVGEIRGLFQFES